MSVNVLGKYLPENTLHHLRKWFGEHYIHIKITKDRKSRLGDYRKLVDGSHKITINATLDKQLFFFVLTHELAHLIVRENYGVAVSPHGSEWKITFGKMLLESISVYTDDLKPLILKFAKSPKANFMASPDLVKYFHAEDLNDELSYVDDLSPGDCFIYRKQKFRMKQRRKKNYLCENLGTGREYIFNPLARVQKID